MPSETEGSPYRRVILTGFMGAGKSTVGRLLAPLLSWQFRDADAFLTANSGATIAELFTRHGERQFRELEAALIADLLHEADTVISLGGGALEHAETRARLAATASTLVVYLQAPLAVSLERCAAETGSALRPVLQDAAVIERRFLARLPFYQTAHLTIATEQQTPQAIAQRVAAALRH